MYMRKTFLLLPLLAAAFLIASCRGGGGAAAVPAQGADILTMRHARNIRLVTCPDYTLAVLRNPWDTLKTLRTYVLVDKDRPLPDNLPEGTVVRTPLSRALVYSSVHCALLQTLGAERGIGGVCDLRYINLPFVHRACERGDMADCGVGTSPDMERIIALHPDAILLSPYQNGGGYGRIEKLDIPIIECADYAEPSALGRAEWMRFYGLLFGREAQADSLFTVVDSCYQRLKLHAMCSSSSYSVLSDLKYGPVWYISGGETTTARLFADACGRYAFADVPSSEALPLSFEAVYDRAGDADIWLIKYNRERDMTYADLAAEYAGYAQFKAFKTRNIYGCNTARMPYYEETPFRPDRLLSDLIQMFHPELRRPEGLRYFTKLKD